MYFALGVLPLFAAVGLGIDYADAVRHKGELQALLDASVLAGAADPADPQGAAAAFFNRTLGSRVGQEDVLERARFRLEDDRLMGAVTWRFDRLFGFGAHGAQYDITVGAEVRLRRAEAKGPCITVLADAGQALLLNSGAKMKAPDCEIHVHSTKDPAFIMNSGVDLDIAKLCVKGNKYIRNGGTVTKLETNCKVEADPHAGKIAEPTVPVTCTTSGARDGASHTLNPGAHCWVNFNGSPTITFKPGLHIIRGAMNINSGSTVIAEGVTFYFPDTDSHIQANGNLTMRATAPTSGTYENILMFEKTSNAANNANKRNYVFNGSNGERLEGVIHLPNRNVTYNSTTNIGASRMSLVVNTLIVNSANWQFEGTGSGAGEVSGFYLSR